MTLQTNLVVSLGLKFDFNYYCLKTENASSDVWQNAPDETSMLRVFCCIVLTLSRPSQSATEQLAARAETTAPCREYFKMQLQVRSKTPLLCSCTTLRTHPARVHIHTHNKTKRLQPGAVGHKGVKSMPVKPKVINYGFQSSQTNCRKRRGKKNREEQNTFNQSRLRCGFCFLIVNLNTVSLARTTKWSYCKIPGRLLTGAANSLPS